MSIAHVDEHPLNKGLPAFGDVNGAIDARGDAFKRYSLLLTQGSWLPLVSTFQNGAAAGLQTGEARTG